MLFCDQTVSHEPNVIRSCVHTIWVIRHASNISVSKGDIYLKLISSTWQSLQNLSVCRKLAQSVLTNSQ